MRTRNFLQQAIMILSLFISIGTMAQTSTKDKKIITDANAAKADFISSDGLMQNLFNNAYGYVTFPM